MSIELQSIIGIFILFLFILIAGAMWEAGYKAGKELRKEYFEIDEL